MARTGLAMGVQGSHLFCTLNQCGARGLLVFAVAVLVGCDGGSPKKSQEVRVQAVIVTKAQASVPLPLLDIHAAPLTEVRKTLVEWGVRRRQQVDAIDAELQRQSQELIEAEARVVAAREAANAVEEERTRKRNDVILPSPENQDTSNPLDIALQKRRVEDAANREFRDQYAAVEDARGETRAATNRVETIRKELSALEGRKRAAGLGNIFSELPRPARSWRTDTSGFATITVPNTEEWVLWATATRQVGASVEVYEWLSRVPSQSPHGGVFYLSGDNLLRNETPEWLTVDH